MIVCYCSKCLPLLDIWGQDVCTVFITLCEVYVSSGMRPFSLLALEENNTFCRCVEFLDEKGAISSHETDECVYIKPRYVYINGRLRDDPTEQAIMFCVEGGHVSVAKE